MSTTAMHVFVSAKRFLPRLACILFGISACNQATDATPSSRSTESQARAQSGAAPPLQWVNPANLRPSPAKPGALSIDQANRVRVLQRTLAEVDPSPADKWLEDFSRDRDPEQEIRVYEAIADAFAAYSKGRTLSKAAKDDVYQVLLLRSGAPDADVMAHLALKSLSTTEAKTVLTFYKSPPSPIQVAPASP